MKALFDQRRRQFREQMLRYLRYVFNDHFILFLFIFFGFVAIQYSRFLQDFPKDHIFIILGLIVLSFLLLGLGRPATYALPADRHFLLPKESELEGLLDRSYRRSTIFWSICQTIIYLLLSPVFIKLGFSISTFLFFLIGMIVLKVVVMRWKKRSYYRDGRLSWMLVVDKENQRQQFILRFFSLFTEVKGLTTSVKPRRYLDGLLALFSKNHQNTWANLYLRAFLRSGDYFLLFCRLFALILLILLFIPVEWVALPIVILLNYLLLFQLISLYRNYDYHYLTKLYPLAPVLKQKGLKQLIRRLMYFLLLVEVLVYLLFFAQKLLGVILVITMLALVEYYLPYKVSKLID